MNKERIVNMVWLFIALALIGLLLWNPMGWPL